MLRLLSAFTLLLFALPADAAVRHYSIGSFERIRVEGPFDVRLTVGTSPGASAEGDGGVTDDIDIRVEGTTLIVGQGVNGWGEQPRAGTSGAAVIRVSTGLIRSAVVIGGGRLIIDGPVRGQRVDLALTGSGTLGVSGVDTDQLYASLTGSGAVTLSGRSARVRLNTNGPGTIEATALTAEDLTLYLDGSGETRATARRTANITTTGIGAATVYGQPACTVKATAGGPISCGKLAAP